ncbi:serine/threonine protein phosphatase [Sharpea azabuensis]|uniref:Serine/threonine protein phosphatase n=1 Tax=Sharpea porci TaxID=2652286 RepID=A0A844FSB7_9FIRM|nr:metallophosphoesterase [Sharpea porci]MST88563.1 serine/threonine protein phosphatase [Sharpea porci]
MNKKYVISDLHGQFVLLQLLLEKIAFDDSDELYVLGDIMDRGPNSIDIYYFIKSMNNIHMIKGNHEIMMRTSLIQSLKYNDLDDERNNAYRLWKQNGGYRTVDSIREYLQKDCITYSEYYDHRKQFMKELIEFIDSLPDYIEMDYQGKHYVLVHAGVDPDKPLVKDTDPELLAWIREYFYMSPCNLDYTYIFGHTPLCFINMDGSFNIWHDPDYGNKIGIDGGLAVGDKGQLNCLCLTTGEEIVIPYREGQQEAIEKRVEEEEKQLHIVRK